MARKSLWKRVRGYFLSFLIAYLLILLLARLFENKLIFFPDQPGRLDGDWHPRGLPVENVWLMTADGVKLHAWWIPAPQAEFSFVAFHGNASNIANRAEVYRFLRELPANVLAVEYRGYGHSEGLPSEEGLYRDAEAGYEYLLRVRGVRPRQIVSFGQSLGTAVAAHLAAHREVGGVVLEAPFPSLRAVARRAYPYLPGLGLVAHSKFDTAGKLPQIHSPVLVVHCAHDPVMAAPLGEEVFRRATEPKFFLRINGTCHEEASMIAPEQYRAQLLSFLARIRADR